MKLQNVLLLVTFAFQSNAKAVESKNNSFDYNYYCSKSNGYLCNMIKKELTSAVNSVSSLIKFSPAIKFDAAVDDLSKYRKDTNNELYSSTFLPDFTPFYSDSNVKSPYPNSKKLIKKIGAGRNYTEDDFVLLFNNFKSDQSFLKNSNYDFKNNAIKEIMKGLLTIDKLEPPYSWDYYFNYKTSKPTLSNAEPEVVVKVVKSVEGSTTPPSNIIPIFDASHIRPYKEDKDICNIVERNRNVTLVEGIYNYTRENCDRISSNNLSTILRWKDRLISKGHSRKLSKKDYKRVIALADIHGDYKKLIKVLRHAKIINKKNQWIAKRTILVQTGDLVDEGDDTIKVYDLMINLKKQALKKNSEVHLLFGNHEMYNMQGRYYHVSGSDFKSFGSLEKREKAFSINGKYGKFIRNEFNLAKIVNDSLFVHAGMYPEYAEMGIENLNKYTRKLLTTIPSFDEICELKKNGNEHPLYTDPLFIGSKSPIDNRNFSQLPEEEICPEVEKTLKITKAKRMVVGHVIQEYGEMITRCNNKLILLDVGMCKCYGNYFGYLEILNDKNEIWLRYGH